MSVDVEQQTYVMIPLNKIVSKLPVRRLSAVGVQRIQESIQRSGFLDNFPIVVHPLGDGTYQLIEGNHRYEAAHGLGVVAVPCIVKTDLSEAERYKLALQSNNAAETVVPSTMVTYAEFIWDRSQNGFTQEAIAEMLGWSRDKVAKYDLLKRICKDAWNIIVTTFEPAVTGTEEDLVTPIVTTVTFTETLLRSILDLTPEQQLELVTELATNKDFSKGKFKSLAENYDARNSMYAYAQQQLGALGESYLSRVKDEIYSGAYDEEWKKSQDTKKKEYGTHPKLDRLIKAVQDEWEEKNSYHLIHGDFYEEIKKIGDASVDLIITDPPYNIANEREFDLDGRSNRSQNFGEWDKYEHRAFIDNFDVWAHEWARILRSSGSGYVFTSYRYASYLVDALEAAGLVVKEMIDWCKTNPGPQIIHTTFRSSVEHILYFTKGNGEHTFHWQGDEEMQTYFLSPICLGRERLVDEKGKTLHATQKPLRVIEHLMSISSNRGDMVFDGFAGTGTAGHAARKLKRKFIGIEKDPVFFTAMQRRLADVEG